MLSSFYRSAPPIGEESIFLHHEVSNSKTAICDMRHALTVAIVCHLLLVCVAFTPLSRLRSHSAHRRFRLCAQDDPGSKTYFATCFNGFEQTLYDELLGHHIRAPAARKLLRGCEFQADMAIALRAVMWSVFAAVSAQHKSYGLSSGREPRCAYLNGLIGSKIFRPSNSCTLLPDKSHGTS